MAGKTNTHVIPTLQFDGSLSRSRSLLFMMIIQECMARTVSAHRLGSATAMEVETNSKQDPALDYRPARMLFSKSLAFVSVVVAAITVNAAPTEEPICAGQTTVSTSFIGQDKNVKAEILSCPGTDFTQHVAARQTAPTPTNEMTYLDSAGATNCFTPSGGGPNNGDCHVIADALLFESENTGPIFQINNGANNTVVMSFRSCKTFFVNQDLGPLAYCRNNWSSLVDIITGTCGAAQNAHGGNCVAADQRWFVQ
ncbi:hypothetical protein PQX77_006943 [Marasmius sp. AFHP31]|nr:hypothetical protein PQX77_006943 [Marasmius sp. AFHP31]